jgi:hypothetical protein
MAIALPGGRSASNASRRKVRFADGPGMGNSDGRQAEGEDATRSSAFTVKKRPNILFSPGPAQCRFDRPQYVTSSKQ